MCSNMIKWCVHVVLYPEHGFIIWKAQFSNPKVLLNGVFRPDSCEGCNWTQNKFMLLFYWRALNWSRPLKIAFVAPHNISIHLFNAILKPARSRPTWIIPRSAKRINVSFPLSVSRSRGAYIESPAGKQTTRMIVQ